jgi:HdeA/HdeB family
MAEAVDGEPTVDVSKIACDEFVKYDIADPRQIAAWTSGYYHGLHNNPVDKQQTLEGSERSRSTALSIPMPSLWRH